MNLGGDEVPGHGQRRLALVRRGGERRRATLGARAQSFGDARVLRTGLAMENVPFIDGLPGFTSLPIKNGDFPQNKSGDFTDFTQKSGVFCVRKKTIFGNFKHTV